ncbi:MAG: hypothetical protein ACI8XV_002371, partial [Arenicella sp.]
PLLWGLNIDMVGVKICPRPVSKGSPFRQT